MAFLGNGNDTFIWNPGDGNDTVDGGNGFDTLDFIGKPTNAARPSPSMPTKSMPTAPGGRVHPCRRHHDLTSVERIQFEAQGQHADNITINDLTGTGVKQVAIDVGAGADNITINDVTGTDLKQVTIDLGAMIRRTRSTSTRPTATRSRSPTTTAWSRCRVWPAT